MKKYIKPRFMTILLNNQAILTGSNVEVDGNPIDGNDVGAKGGNIWQWMGEEE